MEKKDFDREIEGIKQDIAYVSKISAVLANAKIQQKLNRTRIIAIILAVLLALTVAGWLYRESQFEQVVETTETVTTTYEGVEQVADNGGNNTIVGGDMSYGYAEN